MKQQQKKIIGRMANRADVFEVWQKIKLETYWKISYTVVLKLAVFSDKTSEKNV